MLSQYQFAHFFGEPELSEHLGLEVEDFCGMVEKEERMLQQYFP